MKNKKIGIKKTRFFNWCRTLDAITGYRRILFGSEVQERSMITPKMFWILKKIRLHFLDQLQAMFNSNEIYLTT